MKIQVKRIDEDFKLQATSEGGQSFVMDASKDIGGKGEGIRPMDAVLSSLGGCSIIDVITIFRKQKLTPSSLEVVIDADRKKFNTYSLFQNINLHFIIKGEIPKHLAERAVQLSLEKYCSVAKILEPIATITHKITIEK
jgi:putative redox protein